MYMQAVISTADLSDTRRQKGGGRVSCTIVCASIVLRHSHSRCIDIAGSHPSGLPFPLFARVHRLFIAQEDRKASSRLEMTAGDLRR